MTAHYFNYVTYFANSDWERRSFIRQWRRIYSSDPRWVAPHFRQQQLLLHPERNPYLAQTIHAFVRLEALPQRRQSSGLGGPLWEASVAAAILCIDKTATGNIGRLAFLHCVNDEETLDRIISLAQEEFWQHGCRRMLGPTGLSMQTNRGILNDYFHVTPPLHTAYNPPYLPELFMTSLSTVEQSYLFTQRIAEYLESRAQEEPKRVSNKAGQVKLVPLTITIAQSAEFLQLWQSLPEMASSIPQPSMEELQFLWQWLTVWPWWGWVATIDDEMVGFTMLQPDLAEACRVTQGGWSALRRPWLSWRTRKATQPGQITQGCIVCGGVRPTWRRQGVGTVLWQRALEHARRQQWASLTVGPVLRNGTGAKFLQNAGAEAQQSYTLFGTE